MVITREALHATSVPDGQAGLRVPRYFTKEGVHPYDEIEWESRDAVINDWKTGKPAFEQRGVEFPRSWSMNATTIVAQKYFRGSLGTPQREHSVRQMIDRVADTITGWGRTDGYFADEESTRVFGEELKHLLVMQKAAFNSPVWFNCGVEDKPQCSACFILSVEDTMSSILNWYVEEGTIFKGGSGSGVNLSRIRSSREQLRGGGEASGPVSFMRGADASAGTIKSGGKTRRAAKMVILDVDHPDIEEFIWCKQREELKARALREAGFDMDLDGLDSGSIQYQNANNSVRVTDEFMRAVEADAEFSLRAVTTGEATDTLRAKDLMRQIAQAAWECADPGVQYDTIINDWHTTPNAGRINGSNPCSEYMHLDNSACNLASLNLRKFESGGVFDVEAFSRAVEIMFTAQEILVSNSSYPTAKIAESAKAYRQLGMGYTNLGGLLMSQGLAYDSEGGDHRAHDRSRLPHVGGTGGCAGPVRRLRRRPRGDAARHRQAQGCGRADQHRSRPHERRRGGVDLVEGGPRARHRARHPQRPGDGARADRHDQLPDGLRHHRHRAGPRPREDEEAGRWGDDEDRQPDRAGGLGEARLPSRADRGDRRLHRRALHHRGRPGAQARAPAGVRLRDGGALDCPDGSRAHDGGGPAVHQWRSFEVRDR
jgi:hypothetical protein